VNDLFPQDSAPRLGAPLGLARQRAIARRRRRRLIAAVTIPLAMVMVVAIGAIASESVRDIGRRFSGMVSTPPPADFEGPGTTEIRVDIPPGATGSAIGRLLYNAEVVASVGAFNAAFAAHPYAPGIQPGVAVMLTGMSAQDAVDRLVLNERLITRITFPENFTATQVFARIVAQTDITQEEIDAIVEDPSLIGLPEQAEGVIEGWLFPSTYDLSPYETAQSLLTRMVSQTVSVLTSLEVPEDRWRATLIEASIIEREAPNDDFYRAKVSRVIQNRLAINEPLGMDAIDAFGAGRPAHLITREEFRDPNNPWASRVHPGLPPHAIGSAGRAAIYAAANPVDGPWRWFVTVDLCTGETLFTGDYNEFLGFRAQYQAWRVANPDGAC